MYIKNEKLVLLVCSIVLFIANVDITIINAALPSMARFFKIDIIHMDRVIVGFLVAYAIAIPLVEFGVDRFGLKNILVLASFFFAVSSFLCANSSNIDQLNLYRMLQGACAGFFTPIARSVVVKVSPPKDFPVNLSNVQTIGMLGQAIGPFLGSFIINMSSWKYIFYCNIPLCIITIIMCFISFDSKFFNKKIIYKLDFIGYIVISSIIVLIFLILNNFAHNVYWELQNRIEIIIFLLFCIVLYVYIKLYKGKHIFNYNLILSNPTLKNSLYISFIARQFTGCLQFFIVIFCNNLEYSDSMIAYLLLSYGLGIWLSKLFIKIFLRRFKLSRIIQYSLISIFVTNIIVFQAISVFHNTIISVISLLALGLCISLFHSVINIYSLSSVNKSDSTSASSFTSILMYVSQSTSIALFSVFLYFIQSNKIFRYNQYYFTEILLSSALLFAYRISYKFK